MFSVWQQTIYYFVDYINCELILFGIDFEALDREWKYMYLLPALVSALLWPWVFLFLRYLRRRFNVH